MSVRKTIVALMTAALVVLGSGIAQAGILSRPHW